VKTDFKTGALLKKVSASLLIVLVLVLSSLAASPALHKLVHPDADSAEHACAITMFAHGQIAAADVAPIVAGIAVLFGGVALLTETLFLPRLNHCFSYGRGPPVSAW
jgi:hypothetical protein